MVLGIILTGGPSKGTRFRPISLNTPKVLFAIANKPLIQSHIENLLQLGVNHIILLGTQEQDQFSDFLLNIQKKFPN